MDDKSNLYVYGKYQNKWIIAIKREDLKPNSYEILASDQTESDMWRSLAFLYKKHAENLQKDLEEIQDFFNDNAIGLCDYSFNPEGAEINGEKIFVIEVDENEQFFPGSDEPFTWINRRPMPKPPKE